VNVISNDLSKTVMKLREFFTSIEGVKVGIKGGSVVVEGEIVVPADIGRIKVILSREEFKDVIALIELSPQTQRIVARKMQDEIQKAGIKNVTTRVVNRQYWLEGFVTRAGDIQTAIEIAKGLLPDKLDNLAVTTGAVSTAKRDDIKSFISENIKTPPEPLPKLIKITTQFVELTRDYQRVFGFKWTPALAGTGGEISIGKTISGGVTTRSSGTLTGTISNLFPRLSSAKSSGNARLIQQGMVVVKENQQATLSKKTTIPFSLGSGEFTKATSAEAGFDLKIRPSIKTDQNVELDTSLSVSIATSASTPVSTTNNVNTTLLVKSAESAVIGGISFNDTSTDFDKDPPGGIDEFEDASPLFSFVRSKRYVNNKNQFVVFITPEIIDSASRGAKEVRRKFRRRRR
jgi:pilus assembly protein CpaC